ncbi:Crp/Fnr family transcriptional regulator [Romboutsia maritimum]|uniref:Crp/Fnr family transcriptional regulator n=1 Tax=Romboutsia maritimum TaxID=2020948 RepID=A0A371IT43_9FIRM|nr:Crp/Fnr family transcriptional regulator [Romboutsia maritimum]RDY23657.1 Crp/Fnr family transcriptional regulator [Romboutsia maritimum]
MFKNNTKKEIFKFFKDINYKLVNFSKNDIIALENSPCEKIGLILDGHIDIKHILTSNSIIHVSSFGPGHLFGEIIAFSDANVYPATVISSTNSTIMYIDKSDFIKFCTTHPEFLKMFLNDLTNKIITLNKSITGLSFNTIRQKISNFLINENKIQGSNFIKLNMTKQKLSEILGVPRPSLSRELINMKKLGIIDYSKDFIKILDIEALENILME